MGMQLKKHYHRRSQGNAERQSAGATMSDAYSAYVPAVADQAPSVRSGTGAEKASAATAQHPYSERQNFLGKRI
jgi:hypothetical protein